ncbi:MAG TPA: hypothetical protein VIW29_03340 [Polyangiaceae bacterium]
MAQAAPWLASLALAACSVYTSELTEGSGAAVDTGADSAAGAAQASGAHSSGAGRQTGSGAEPAAVAGGTGSGVVTEPQTGGEGAEGGAGQHAEGGASGSGAVTSGGTSPGSGASGGSSPASDLLDGFEDEDLTLEQSNGRGGVWYLFDDGSVGKVGPVPLTSSPLSDAPAALGLYALHVTASGFTGWGSGLGVDFRAGKKPYDGTGLSGIRFWARVGAGKNTRHRMQIADGSSDALGGKCNPAVAAPEGEKCEDHFGINLTLTTSWKQYVVRFSELSQIGWGAPAAALDTTTLYGLQLTAKSKLDVDVWLDELEFF